MTGRPDPIADRANGEYARGYDAGLAAGEQRTLDRLAEALNALGASLFQTAIVNQIRREMSLPVDVIDECWCRRCDSERRQRAVDGGAPWSTLVTGVMIVCPDCGNKRCPRAGWHQFRCGASNEPGQVGVLAD